LIDPSTHIGAVHLTIGDLNLSVRFYEAHLGFRLHRRDDRSAGLGAGGPDLVVLTQCEQAPRVRGTTGLYHFAILVPSRGDLARALRRLVETETVMQGAADHGVSEALYLADVDGNGIEIYRDRPRAEWPFVGGRLQMGADPLDFDDLLAAADEAALDTDAAALNTDAAPLKRGPTYAPNAAASPSTPSSVGHRFSGAGLPSDTVVGHVHLHVSRLDEAQRFYVDVLGFELMQRYGPSALFVSAGGYHHHIGLNTWAGVGAPPPPPGAIGLRHFDVVLPTDAAVHDVRARVTAAGIPSETIDGGILVRDPANNAIRITRSA